MKLLFHVFQLKMKHTFTIAHGSRNAIDGFVVELREGRYRGFGEAAPIPYYGVSSQSMIDILEKHRTLIENYDLQNPEDFWAFMQPFLNDNPFAQCALDIAAHDLWGKKIGKPLYKIWGLNLRNSPLSNFTIGIDTIENMVLKMEEVPFPIYKIKLGTANDVAIVRELRQHTKARFRVDANGAWGVDETIHNSKIFKDLNIEFIEQPLQANAYEAMTEVKKHALLPIIADESCIAENDIEKCYKKFDGVNIKLAKCGGITPARRMIKQARALNMQVMVGCMTESSVGISAIGQLLPLLDFVDMDGAMLIANDPAEGVFLKNGKAIFPKRNGTGAKLKH